MPDGRPSVTTVRKASDEAPLSWGEAAWSSDISGQTAVYVKDGAVYGERRSTGPTDGLVAWWRLNDDNSLTTLTDSVGGYHGDLYGATYENTERGTAVYFDGNDHAALEFPIEQSFTASVWAKSGPSRTWSEDGVLFSARNANGFIIHPENVSTSWSGFVVDTVTNSYHRVADKHPISQIDSWHQYVITYDHTTGAARTYVDGVEQGATTLNISRQSSTITARLGRDTANFDDRYYVGHLSEARIYSRALSAAEVETLHTATKIP